ncbi:MAG: helix-turn-helix domain-containing protein [Bacteroidaceae bacterium]|nr:helix-turn-helix domain-containing protein [Bacteroidaceae bacterium]
MHIGKLIKQRMDEQGKTVVWLARQLSYSRTNVYKIYDKASIDTDVLLRISSILEYDFFSLYSDSLKDDKNNVPN